MAMTTPIGVSFIPYSVLNNHTFEFLYSGGNQVIGNTLKIYDSVTGTLVYDKTILATDPNRAEALQYKHTVYAIDVASTMTNGAKYYFTFVAIGDGQQSLVSSQVNFYCYTTPITTITNIPSSREITSSNYTFTVRYTQSENQIMELGNIILYDASGLEIANSGYKYNPNSEPSPFEYSHTFNGMINGNEYSVVANTVGVDGSISSSSREQFHVSYVTPDLFTLIEATNSCSGGYIQVDSNVRVIDGITLFTPPIYLNDNTRIDLTRMTITNGRQDYCQWQANFNIDDDFTAGFWLGSPVGIEPSVLMTNGETTLTINLILDYSYGETELKACALLNVKMKNDPTYVLYSYNLDVTNYSNFISVDDVHNERLFVSLRKINNIYSIKLEVVA